MGLAHRERALMALDHKEPDRAPVDLGGYPIATSINVSAYEKLLAWFSIQKELHLASTYYFTSAVDEEILDRLDVDTISLNDRQPRTRGRLHSIGRSQHPKRCSYGKPHCHV